MNITNFKKHLKIGREIEFSFEKRRYFASKCFDIDNDDTYYIWDVNDDKELIRGNMDSILTFLFYQKISLNDNSDKFKIDYIL